MSWIMENWKTVLDIVAYVVLAASLIARITPWTWDDTAVGFMLRLLSLAPKNPANQKLL